MSSQPIILPNLVDNLVISSIDCEQQWYLYDFRTRNILKYNFEYLWLGLDSSLVTLVLQLTTTNCHHYFRHSYKHCWYHRTYMAWWRNEAYKIRPNQDLAQQPDSIRLHWPTNNLPIIFRNLVDIREFQSFVNAVQKHIHEILAVVVSMQNHQFLLWFQDTHLNRLNQVVLVDRLHLLFLAHLPHLHLNI